MKKDKTINKPPILLTLLALLLLGCSLKIATDIVQKRQALTIEDKVAFLDLYSTTFSGLGGKFDQKVGGFSYRNGDFGLRYENDLIKKPLVGVGGLLADGQDRWRTTALQVGYKDYSLNLKFFTGEPDKENRITYPGAKYGLYNNKEADLYRLGATSFGYKGYQLGYNSEKIRGFVQNKIIHNNFTDSSGWFRELPQQFPSALFFQYQSANRYTLW